MSEIVSEASKVEQANVRANERASGPIPSFPAPPPFLTLRVLRLLVGFHGDGFEVDRL